MLLSELLASAGLSAREAWGDAEVASVIDDSRQAKAGACFVAVRGTADDGHRYIRQAVSGGCSAVICCDRAAAPAEAAWALLSETRGALGPLAQAMHGWPGRQLKVVGITGTNGKTTVCWLLRHILAKAGRQAGLIGTISYETAGQRRPAGTTTPDPIDLAAMMAEMVAAGQRYLVMEVSSHALAQERVGGVDFAVGVLTNVSGDHLDYHKTMEAYQAAKLRLFESLGADATAVINRDDAAAEVFAAATAGGVTFYGLSPAADVQGRIEHVGIDGTRFTLLAEGRQAAVATPLIGRHNVFNCLAAATAAMKLEAEPEAVAEALGSLDRIPGRLEPVPVEAAFRVFVDYAHTDDALANVLRSLRPVTKGRLIVVFGCGGDRDRSKRPRMARVAADLADHVVVTSDNPRSEPPQAIVDEILTGLDAAELSAAEVVVERRDAIECAIRAARADDVVLIAGKGHETYQILGQRRVHFDDVEVAAGIMSELQ